MTREEARLALQDNFGYLSQEHPRILEALRVALEALSQPSLPSNLDEAAEESSKNTYPYEDDCHIYDKNLVDEAREYYKCGFKVGADFGAKKMLAKLRENCVIINKDLYEIAMEGKFIEGKEEGIKWMAGKFQKIEGELVDWYETKGVDYCCGIKTEDAFEVPEGFYIRKKQ